MKSVVVGTAGHIDHGKTALVRALTGIDADRLAEEKRRGITIDLGFAHMELTGPEGPVRLGFVDVPGHERFVRNMLAGAGGIDLVLLVISAAESIKPQTREHFDICRLLQVEYGITVLTKTDLVDRETLDVVRLEVEEFVRGSFLDACRSPIVEVSALTGEGLDRLKRELAGVASQAAQKDSQAALRLPVDRVFTMKGFGTVVTGTMVAGELHREQEIEVLPAGLRARVRGIQVHGVAADAAHAGQRTAVNLAGVAQEELARGMMLAETGLLRPVRRLDVKLSLLKDAPPLRNHHRVHLHLFTSETVASLRIYGADELRPGEDGWVQLRTAQPVVCIPGDRFIVRRFSPISTIGGGVVADVAPPRRLKPADRVTMLAELMEADDAGRLRLLVARRAGRGLRVSEATHETGWARRRLQSAITAATKSGAIAGFGEIMIAVPALDEICAALLVAVQAFQSANPLRGGISREELLEKSGVERDLFTGALERLLAAKKLESSGELLHLPGRGVEMKADEAQSKQQIEEAFAKAGVQVPALKEVLGGLKIDLPRAQRIVTLLLRERVLVKISEELIFHQQTLEELKLQVRSMKQASPRLDVARFKDTFGVTRKYAIPLLEFLDREHITRRAGDDRIIL
jgi:selenocysteine-specific elongation factor